MLNLKQRRTDRKTIVLGLILMTVCKADVLVFRGTSDASGAAPIGRDSFVLADDENNVLRGYRLPKGRSPIFSYNLTEFLHIDPKRPEVDIEGAARVGDRVYWISSHGRNVDGKVRSSRYRFFATRIMRKGNSSTLVSEGRICTSITQTLLKLKNARQLGLDKAMGLGASLNKKQRKQLAPKREGLNIEGLCASANGEVLYIGFRNPRPRQKALVVPLINPTAVVEKGDTPEFAQPLLWDLKNLGIRAMEYSSFHKAFFIVAGAHNADRVFMLYAWSGKHQDSPKYLKSITNQMPDFTPESLIAFKDNDSLLVLSDDGSRVITVSGQHECLPDTLLSANKCLNKHLLNANQKTFRGIWLLPE